MLILHDQNTLHNFRAFATNHTHIVCMYSINTVCVTIAVWVELRVRECDSEVERITLCI